MNYVNRFADVMPKYEVYIPDGRGDMNLQFLTVAELKTLLARQSNVGNEHPASAYFTALQKDKV